MKPNRYVLLIIIILAVLFSCEENEFDFSDPLYKPVDPSPMIQIDSGSFNMGSDYSTGIDPIDGVSDEGFSDEWPEREVFVDTFSIETTEVSNAQYRACVLDDGCTDPQKDWSVTRDLYYLDSDFDDYPVLFVTWEQAEKYCRWLDRRLPTEAEWEKAAKGEDESVFPWGFELPDCDMANFSKIISEFGTDDEIIFTEACYKDTLRVDQFQNYGSSRGVLNMAGNVSEWVADWYDPEYYENHNDPEDLKNPTGPENGDHKVHRGGSFADNVYFIRTAYRGHASVNQGFSYIGFRCAK